MCVDNQHHHVSVCWLCIDALQEYWVTLPQDPTPKQLQLLRAGTVIEGVQVVPQVVKVLQSSSTTQQQYVQQTAATQAVQGSENSRRNGSGRHSSGGRGGRCGGGGRGTAGDAPGRCVLQLDVSEGKKHEVGMCRCLNNTKSWSKPQTLQGLTGTSPLLQCTGTQWHCDTT